MDQGDGIGGEVGVKSSPNKNELALKATLDAYIQRMRELEKPVERIQLDAKQFKIWKRMAKRCSEHYGCIKGVQPIYQTYQGLKVEGPGGKVYTKRDLERLF